MNPEMKIIREVSDQAEEFYADAVRLGDHAAIALKGGASLSDDQPGKYR